MPDQEKFPDMRRRRCSDCGCLRHDVKTRIDPYLEDVYDETDIRPICEDCYQTLIDDI